MAMDYQCGITASRKTGVIKRQTAQKERRVSGESRESVYDLLNWHQTQQRGIQMMFQIVRE